MPIREQKRQDAKKYYLTLATELRICQHSLTLLQTLVPDRNHPKIVKNLDTALLMQQVEKGVVDIVRLLQWIADLLKVIVLRCGMNRLRRWHPRSRKAVQNLTWKRSWTAWRSFSASLKPMKLVRYTALKIGSTADCERGRCKSPNSNLWIPTD